jgi:hypothetical protein
MGKRLPEVPKSFMFEGWSIPLEGNHMKTEAAFVAETKRFWDGDEAKAKEAWKTGQLVVTANKKAEKVEKTIADGTFKPDDSKV